MAGMLDFFKNPPTKDVTAGAGGLRDLYLAYIEENAMKGLPAMPFPEFVKMIREQERMRQQQMQTPPQGGMLQ